jgi:hypothetical protein
MYGGLVDQRKKVNRRYLMMAKILSCVGVTVDGVWIGDSIY